MQSRTGLRVSCEPGEECRDRGGVLSQRALQIRVRLTQFQTFFMEGVLKGGSLSIKLDVETPHFEEISDAEKNFQVIEGLEQEVGRTCAKGGAFCFLICISGQNDDREEDIIAGGAKGAEDRKPINVRHHQIEQDQVRREGVTSFEG